MRLVIRLRQLESVKWQCFALQHQIFPASERHVGTQIHQENYLLHFEIYLTFFKLQTRFLI
jgi:hypothetical protein